MSAGSRLTNGHPHGCGNVTLAPVCLPPCPCLLLPCPPHPTPAANSASLELDYLDLAGAMPVVAIWLADLPREVLPILHETAKEVALEEFEDFSNVHEGIYVRVSNIPIAESIRDLRCVIMQGGE